MRYELEIKNYMKATFQKPKQSTYLDYFVKSFTIHLFQLDTIIKI
jgi:hypothetical protein